MDCCETREHRGYTIKIYHDPDSGTSPRDWCNLGTFIAWHKNYMLSDADVPDCTSPQDFEEWAQAEEIPYCFPLFMYDHSGVALSLSPFHDPWDSGQVGYVYVTDLRIGETYVDAKPTEEEVFKILQGEVEIYSSYINGEVYGYVVEDAEGFEVDSCWGFVGDSGTWDHLISEAQGFVDWHISEQPQPGRWARFVAWFRRHGF